MTRSGQSFAYCVLAGTLAASPPGLTAQAPTRDYRVAVASEATDQVAFVRFGPGGTEVERTITIGMNPVDPDGPHGLGFSPDEQTLFVSTAHGTPFGSLWKYDVASGRVLGKVELDLFPATLQVSPDGHYVFVANANFHGDHVPSSISIVAANEMLEVARLETCVMPHGSRFNASGTRHYSACMMDDALVEIDATNFTVARHFLLATGKEHGGTGALPRAAMTMGDHQMPMPKATCSPTWAAPTPDGSRVFVACNAANDIAEIDVRNWTLTRRIPAGKGVYNLAVSHDGRLLVATNKKGQSVSVFDAESGKHLADIATLRKVVHGVAISSDDRYAFISVEGYGAEPGTLEVIDLTTLARVGSVDVGQMAGGVDVLK